MSNQELYHELNKELSIDDSDLDFELQRQPSKFAYWGALYAKATKNSAKEKLKLKELEAKIARDFRAAMKRKTKERITDSVVNSYVVSTEQHQEQARRVIDAELEENLMNVAKEGFRQRSQMLLQLCKLRLDESWQSDFTIYQKEAKGRYNSKKRTKEAMHGLLAGKKGGGGKISDD